MFRIVSDLHLEGMISYILPKTDNEEHTVLILAGDICEFPLLETHMGYQQFLGDCNNRFKKVIYVPGNHEYYGTSLSQFGKWKEAIEERFSNIKVLDRESVVVPMTLARGEVNFNILGATLWTDMNNNDPLTLLNGKNFLLDFERIHGGFKPEDMVEENNKSRQFLRYALLDSQERVEPTIVVTHHGPTFKSVHPRYKNMPQWQNCLFVNNRMEEYFDNHSLRLWVHGHTHESIDHLLGHCCRVVCNPKGITGYSYSISAGMGMNHQNKSYDELFAVAAADLYF